MTTLNPGVTFKVIWAFTLWKKTCCWICAGAEGQFSADQAWQHSRSVKVMHHYSQILQPQITKSKAELWNVWTSDRLHTLRSPSQTKARRTAGGSACRSWKSLPSNFLLCLSSLSSNLSSPYCFQLYVQWESVWWPLLQSSFTLKSYPPNSCNMAHTAGSLPLRPARPLLFSVLYPLNSPAWICQITPFVSTATRKHG